MWSISAEQRCGSVGRGGESAAKIVAAGGRTDVATFDVTDTAALQQWIQGAADSTGRLDVLVNNAGFGAPDQTIADGDPEFWRGMLETNVLALAVGCQAAIKAMRTTTPASRHSPRTSPPPTSRRRRSRSRRRWPVPPWRS